MTNIIVSLILFSIIALAILKIISEKRKGTRCIGCADSGKCSSTKNHNKTPVINNRVPIKQVL